MNHNALIFALAGLTAAGIVIRPWRMPEAVWAVLGAALLVVFGLLSWRDALAGVLKGTDVYLFLIGMMLLAELARAQGLFDWLAARAARLAGHSPGRLFTLLFSVGTLVTAFLSNDATAVVLTPAVAAVMKTVKAEEPLPYLLVCALIANAASFVLPISNPANLVLYGSQLPPLLHWLSLFALPSVLAILATYALLRFVERARLRRAIVSDVAVPALSACAHLTAWGIAATAVALLVASGYGVQLGLPAFLAGLVTAVAVFVCSRSSLLTPALNMDWGILALVAGLFVLVQALEQAGATAQLAGLLRVLTERSVAGAAWLSGAVLAFGCNLVNNLPAGLFAQRAAEAAQLPERVRAALLIGVDLGPNLSVTGSLATILWLTALRRDGFHIGTWAFLKVGALVMPPALALALAGIFVSG